MDEYEQRVERELLSMSHRYHSTKRKGTSCKDVLQFMVDNHNERIWWWSWEFVGKSTSKGGYLSHKAPARASDLALHTDLVEDKRIGRFKIYRVKKEKREEVLAYLKGEELSTQTKSV